MWTPEQRPAADRRGLRYPHDLGDAEWAFVAPLIRPRRQLGADARSVCARFSMRSSICSRWDGNGRAAAEEHRAFLLHSLGLEQLERIHESRYVAVCKTAGRAVSPSAAIVDLQSVRGAKGGGFGRSARLRRGQEGYGPQALHLRRCALLLLGVCILRAHIQERGGAQRSLQRVRRRFWSVERIFADEGYEGPKIVKVGAATNLGPLEIAKGSDLRRFVTLRKRWIVERAFPWISRNRTLTHDCKRYNTTIFVRLAMIRIMLTRFTRPSPCASMHFFQDRALS